MKRLFWTCPTGAIWCLTGFLQPRNIAECWACVTELTLKEAPHFGKASGLCSPLQFMSSIGLAGFYWVAPPVPPLSLANPCLESYDNLGTVMTILLQLLQVSLFHKLSAWTPDTERSPVQGCLSWFCVSRFRAGNHCTAQVSVCQSIVTPRSSRRRDGRCQWCYIDLKQLGI